MKKLLDFFKANWKFLVIACLLAVASFEIIQMRNDLNCIEGKLGALTSQVNSIRSDIGSIQEDIGSLQEDVSSIADYIEGIQSDASRQAANRIAAPLQKTERKIKRAWL
jgi:uncharacterized protein YoxC